VHAGREHGRPRRDRENDHRGDDRPVAPPADLPKPNTALIDPELAWSIGLGLIVVVVAIALIRESPRRPRRLR